MNNDVPIIFNAGLYDNENKLYAKADCLVKINQLHNLIHVPAAKFHRDDLNKYICI